MSESAGTYEHNLKIHVIFGGTDCKLSLLRKEFYKKRERNKKKKSKKKNSEKKGWTQQSRQKTLRQLRLLFMRRDFKPGTKKGVYHKRTVSRKISRLSKAVNSIA